jgi:glucose-1-phosphate adenylyltransferase
VLFKESAVGKNAQLSYIIADKNVVVQDNRTLMGHATYPIVVAKGSVV